MGKKDQTLLEARYKRKLDVAIKHLELALAEKLRLLTPEQQVKDVVSKSHEPITVVGKQYVTTDLLNQVYYKFGKPFLRFRFRLHGAKLDFVVEEIDDEQGTETGHSTGANPGAISLIGPDGRPIRSGK